MSLRSKRNCLKNVQRKSSSNCTYDQITNYLILSFRKTMGDFLQVCPKRLCISTVGKRVDLFPRDPSKVPITDFFGSVRNVELTQQIINLTENSQPKNNENNSDDDAITEQEKSKTVLYEYQDPLPIFKQMK